MANYDRIICGSTTGSASSSSLNTLGKASEISIKSVSGSSTIATEVGFSREGSVVFSDEDNLYYQLTSGSWIAYTPSGAFTTLDIDSMLTDWTNAGRTIADLGTVTTADVDGGTIDATIIGGSSASAGSFTTVTTPRAIINEAGATTTPTANNVAVYAKADGLIYSKDDAGLETLMSSGSASGKLFYSVESISANKTLGDSDCVILASGSPTISLPTAIGITGKGISY